MYENLYWYRAELIRCVDGDSAWFFVDRGFKDFSKLSVRLARIDCPEMRGAPEEVEKGIAATEFAQQMYDRSTNIILKSVKLDSFGRAIAEVYLEIDGEWRNLSDDLVGSDRAIYKQY